MGGCDDCIWEDQYGMWQWTLSWSSSNVHQMVARLSAMEIELVFQNRSSAPSLQRRILINSTSIQCILCLTESTSIASHLPTVWVRWSIENQHCPVSHVAHRINVVIWARSQHDTMIFHHHDEISRLLPQLFLAALSIVEHFTTS